MSFHCLSCTTKLQALGLTDKKEAWSLLFTTCRHFQGLLLDQSLNTLTWLQSPFWIWLLLNLDVFLGSLNFCPFLLEEPWVFTCTPSSWNSYNSNSSASHGISQTSRYISKGCWNIFGLLRTLYDNFRLSFPFDENPKQMAWKHMLVHLKGHLITTHLCQISALIFAWCSGSQLCCIVLL